MVIARPPHSSDKTRVPHRIPKVGELPQVTHVRTHAWNYEDAEDHQTFLPQAASQPFEHWTSAAGLEPDPTVTKQLGDIDVATPTGFATAPSELVRETPHDAPASGAEDRRASCRERVS